MRPSGNSSTGNSASGFFRRNSGVWCARSSRSGPRSCRTPRSSRPGRCEPAAGSGRGGRDTAACADCTCQNSAAPSGSRTMPYAHAGSWPCCVSCTSASGCKNKRRRRCRARSGCASRRSRSWSRGATRCSRSAAELQSKARQPRSADQGRTGCGQRRHRAGEGEAPRSRSRSRRSRPTSRSCRPSSIRSRSAATRRRRSPSREAEIGSRERTLAEREAGLAAREKALAQRESEAAQRWKDTLHDRRGAGRRQWCHEARGQVHEEGRHRPRRPRAHAR